MKRFLSLILPLAACATASDPVALEFGGSPLARGAQHGEAGRVEHPHDHHVAYGFGIVTGDEGDAVRSSLEYERAFDPDWGLLSGSFGFGLMVELDGRPREELLVAPQLTYHPVPQMRFVLAPGYAFREGEEDEWLLRTGAAWEFELNGGWSLAPQVFVDFREAGERGGVLALALGYSF